MTSTTSWVELAVLECIPKEALSFRRPRFMIIGTDEDSGGGGMKPRICSMPASPNRVRSSILAIFDDYEQWQKGAPPIVQPMLPQWLDLAFADRTRIEVVVDEAIAIQPNISAKEFQKFVEGRAAAVQSIAAFLVANMSFDDDEDIDMRVNELAANTLAYHLADAVTRERLVNLFRRIAQTVFERTDGPGRLLIRRSPLPPAAVADLRV